MRRRTTTIAFLKDSFKEKKNRKDYSVIIMSASFLGTVEFNQWRKNQSLLLSKYLKKVYSKN